jgi:microtubule-associated serine/threonine kinase
MRNNLRQPIIIHRGPRSFGFTLRAVKVFHGNTDYYTTQHVVVAVQGPAEAAGLKPNDVITHVNDHPVVGLIHSEVVKLILSGSQKLSIRAIPCSETQIRTGGRRRSPSKQKIRYQQLTEKKSEYHSHQPYCQKYRMNSLGTNTLNTNANNSNKKHQQNTSLFRRLSERKVARDIEAAAAAGVSLTIPTTTCTNTTNKNNPKTTTITTTTNTNTLSSSLPMLSFNQSTLDPSEWPPLKPTSGSDSLQPTLLPSIVKQKSQVSIFKFL